MGARPQARSRLLGLYGRERLRCGSELFAVRIVSRGSVAILNCLLRSMMTVSWPIGGKLLVGF